MTSGAIGFPNMTALRKIITYQKRYFKYDLMASIVVFLVAIPLCLGVALASGAPLFSGIIAGIVGGIVVGSFSASPVSVSGPAAGLVTVVYGAITYFGDFNIFLLSVVIAGLIQIIIGILRAGFIGDYIPSNVIQGLLCAIGILIAVKQLPLAFTHPLQTDALMSSLKEAAQAFNIEPLISLVKHINMGATIISIVSISILIAGDKIDKKKFKLIPAPVIVVFAGIFINELYLLFFPSLIQNSTQLVNIPVNSHISSFLAQFEFPAWHSLLNPNVYFYGVLIAALASLESLLNIKAAENLDKRKRYSSLNRELVAQGIGNTIAGLIGGIPLTSVIVRSSVNIQTGARTKASTILHGFFILIVTAFAAKWLNHIPLASLAAILIYIGYKLSNVSIYKNMYAQGFERFFPFLVTVLAIIFTNLLVGVLIGLFTSFFFILKSNSQIHLDLIVEKHPAGMIRRLMLPQQVSFLRKASLIAELNSIPENSQLIIDASYTEYIDKDILELIKEFTKSKAADKKIALNLVGFKKHYNIHDHIDFINVTTFDVQAALTPKNVLEILLEGNKRFLKNQRIHRNFLFDIKATSVAQHPIAVVLGCIDSRVPVEAIFDMGMGDLFCVRIAGNVVNEDIIASIEFACHIGAKLIVILGHTRCGAIHAACNGVKHGHIDQLLDKIKPAIDNVKALDKPNWNAENQEFLLEVTKSNINNSLQTIAQGSEIIQRLLQDETIAIVSAIYNVENGKVKIVED